MATRANEDTQAGWFRTTANEAGATTATSTTAKPTFTPTAAEVLTACEQDGAGAILPGSEGVDQAAVPDNTPRVCVCWTSWVAQHLSATDQRTLLADDGSAVGALQFAKQLYGMTRAQQQCDINGTPADSGAGTATATATATAGTATATQPTTPADTATTPIQTTAPSSHPVAADSPLGTLATYWNLIAAGEYSSAWRQLASGAGQPESGFVSGERQAGITGTSFTGHVSANDGSTATVQVDSLITHDHQFGCRSWSGTYDLVHQHGRWLIEKASITPAACG